MIIHVVRPGDNVWTVARIYRANPQRIIEVNQLRPPAALAIGQTLIVPVERRNYRVMPGDNIWSISMKFGVSPASIIQANNIQNPSQLFPGRVIVIPSNAKRYGRIETNGFIQPSNPEKERNVINQTNKLLTYITPFSHHVNADASLTPLNDEAIKAAAARNNSAVLLSVTNISGVVGANFNTELIDKILNDNTLQTKLIDNMLNLIRTGNYKGVVIDFEKISPNNREKYNNFLRKVVARLHPNYLVGTALAPKTYDVKSGAWHGAHDYRAHGQIVDFVVIMTYEWGWSGGPPMAVAPINEVRKVIDYAVSVIPSRKILMGVPLYGYDWTLPYMPGGEFAESIGNQEGIDRALKHGAIIKYDTKSQSPYYSYIDSNRRQHVVWFEDARSVQAKYKLASAYKLRGVSYWALGKPFPQNWAVLDDMFQLVK